MMERDSCVFLICRFLALPLHLSKAEEPRSPVLCLSLILVCFFSFDTDMDGSFLGDLQSIEDFFSSEEEKPLSVAVVTTTTAPEGDHPPLGIYQNEESIDLSALLEAYQGGGTSSAGTQQQQQQHGYPRAVDPRPSESALPPQTDFPTFGSITQSIPPSASVPVPASHHPPASAREVNTTVASGVMYGSERYQTGPAEAQPACTSGRLPSSSDPALAGVNPGAAGVDLLVGTRPAPGKAKSSRKKRELDRDSEEYREKRTRNNIAVRRSRQKTKQRVMETEFRVRELESENAHLQSKIALLTKELNVLKSLFTSAGVAHPPPLRIKEEQRGQQ